MLRVLDCVYAAGCTETSWDRAVAEMCRGAGFSGCALISIDPLVPEPVVLASHGLSDRAALPTPRNPLLTAEVLGSAPGTVWQDREVMRPAQLATTSYWTGWMQPQGLVSWAGIILGRDGSQVACLEIYDRVEGAASYRADLLAQLAPHLTRAWRLGKPGQPTPQPGGLPAVIRLRAEFGLTKAEARLALALADGASLASMAAAFDVKLTTIRSQLQQVFGKTGTSRQAELVSLLLSQGYLSPVEPVPEPALQGAA